MRDRYSCIVHIVERDSCEEARAAVAALLGPEYLDPAKVQCRYPIWRAKPSPTLLEHLREGHVVSLL